MGSDSLAENTPHAPEFICSICLPKLKSSAFQWKKASLGVRSPWFLGRALIQGHVRDLHESHEAWQFANLNF
jgi:hypothetical protein